MAYVDAMMLVCVVLWAYPTLVQRDLVRRWLEAAAAEGSGCKSSFVTNSKTVQTLEAFEHLNRFQVVVSKIFGIFIPTWGIDPI